MKPSRGKRRGPQSPRVGFNSPAFRRRRSVHAERQLLRRRTGWRRAHFRRGERHDRFAGGQKRLGKVTSTLPSRCYRPLLRWPAGGPRKTRSRSASGLVLERSFKLGGLSPVPTNRDRLLSGSLAVDLASVANRSVACPTRLETRTKESNMCASRWARTKPGGAVKAKAISRWLR